VRSFGADEKATREAAEREVAPLLRGFVARRKFAFILGQTRRRVAMRESLRFERTRVFGHVRRLFRAFGDRFVEGGFLRHRDDVFYLTVDEILGFVRGTTASVALQATSDLRRAEFAAYRAAEPPDERFWTWGAVHVANQYRRPTAAEPPPTGDEMKGTPCSPGVIVATARVVRDPREIPDLKGAILVAHRTDPGWIPLYPTAGAILVERGSLLSHSAVVARELGIPGIVGARGLLSVGDRRRDHRHGRHYRPDLEGRWPTLTLPSPRG
jgi:phosphohistidine swiveling domain-containing protein